MKSAKAISFTDAPVPGAVDRVHALQQGLYQAAKQDGGRRFHALYDKLSRGDVLKRAWMAVAVNGGAAGVDGSRFVMSSTSSGFLRSLTGSRRNFRPTSIGLHRCGVCTSPSQVNRARPARWVSRDR